MAAAWRSASTASPLAAFHGPAQRLAIGAVAVKLPESRDRLDLPGNPAIAWLMVYQRCLARQ